MIAVTIPLRTVSEANSHEHWRKRQKRAKGQRDAAGLVVRSELYRQGLRDWWAALGRAAVVTLTRIAPRSLDSDNLSGSQKHVRDGVADAMFIDDRDPRVTWAYAQERGAKGQYAVRIEIRRAM
jgi:hypothetical protein